MLVMKNGIILGTFAFLLSIFFINEAQAQRKAPKKARAFKKAIKWEKLGSRKVDYKLDRDVVHVGLQDGFFTRLKLVVTNGSLNLHKVKIQYMNGDTQIIPAKHAFKRTLLQKLLICLEIKER